MKVVFLRAVPVALALALMVNVHGTEFLTAIEFQPKTGCRDCACSKDCGCRGPVKSCNCSSEGLDLKARCGCGCSDSTHMTASFSWESVLAQPCAVGKPHLTWSSTTGPGDPQSWRLAHELDHPPRTLPERISPTI